MSVDAVEALSMEDFGDDVDPNASPHRIEDQENAPPKRTFSKPIFASPSGGMASRPVTANSTMSELEEMSLDHAFAPPNRGAHARGGNFPTVSVSARGFPSAAAAASSPGGHMLHSPPWSPASNGIPTLDEYEEMPATPVEKSRNALHVVSSADHVAAAAVSDLTDLNATVSPTPSEKAKKDGCAVM
jgi:hypothetical protein